MGSVHQSLSPSPSVKEWGDRQYGPCSHGRRHWRRYCGFFNGLSWGVCTPVCGFSATNSGFGGPTFGQTNIDYGLAAVSSQTGKFEAIRTTSMMVHATYYLPDDGKTWVGGGYGTVYSSNAAQMTCTTSRGGLWRGDANVK